MTDRVKIASDICKASGWIVGSYIESTGDLAITKVRAGGMLALLLHLESAECFGDRETFVRYVEGKINLDRPTESKWTQYVGHSVLICPIIVKKQIRNVRVEAVAPSGKYVYFLDLLGGPAFWTETDEYDLLEDLGQRMATQPLKPVARM